MPGWGRSETEMVQKTLSIANMLRNRDFTLFFCGQQVYPEI